MFSFRTVHTVAAESKLKQAPFHGPFTVYLKTFTSLNSNRAFLEILCRWHWPYHGSRGSPGTRRTPAWSEETSCLSRHPGATSLQRPWHSPEVSAPQRWWSHSGGARRPSLDTRPLGKYPSGSGSALSAATPWKMMKQGRVRLEQHVGTGGHDGPQSKWTEWRFKIMF